MLTSEYGWNTEYILTRTMHEIGWRIDKIITRHNQDLEKDAKMHGMEIKTSKPAGKVKELDPGQEDAMHNALQEAKKRKALEHGR